MRGHSWIILYFLNSLRPIFFGLVDCLFSWLSTTDLFFFFALLDLFLTLHNFFFFFCLPVSSLHDGFFLVSLALFLTLHSIFFSFFLILLFCLPFSSLHDNFSYRFPKYLRRIFLLSFVDRFLSMTAFSFFSLSLLLTRPSPPYCFYGPAPPSCVNSAGMPSPTNMAKERGDQFIGFLYDCFPCRAKAKEETLSSRESPTCAWVAALLRCFLGDSWRWEHTISGTTDLSVRESLTYRWYEFGWILGLRGTWQ